ncbi:MAG: hypothetical protein Q4C73_09680 [Eubacteriales bacterium]|nr:hypothetical protein [Eubacteriales bacterium]
MMNTFESYLKEPYVLDFNQMQSLHSELISEIGNDADAIELYEELVDAATKYAAIRAGWMRLSREEKMDTDSLRTSHHNSMIIHFNMLARYLRMQGKKAAWRDQLGNEEDNSYCRKTIGDFGCYIVFVNSICAR